MIWIKTQEPYVLLISVVLVSIFLFLMISRFFYPLWPIHKKLKRRKEEEIDRILDEISLSAIKREINMGDAIHTHLLLDTSNKDFQPFLDL